MADPTPLDTAIAQLESQRAALGDAAVDAAIAALRGSAAGPAVPRLRQVSILFVDIAESTAMLQRLGAEDALALVNGALETFARIVRQHGGEVLRFTGDGLKAAFGTRARREDDARQAVRAGLRLIEAAGQHGRQVARTLRIERFGVRVGIHTGTVLLGGGAEADRTAMGHAVHVAARMEQSAPAGRLRISQETWVQVRDHFRVQAQAPLALKGVAEPLRTYLVLGEEDDSESTIRRSIEGVRAPFVGRAETLERLVAHVEAALRGQGSTTACVVGDAGIGKTRLRRELMRRLEAREGAPAPAATPATSSAAALAAVAAAPSALAKRGQLHVLRATARPGGGLQPFGLVRELLARWLGIADDLPAAQARARFVEALAPWLGEQANVRAERLGQLVGLDFGDRPGVQALGGRELRAQGLAALREALQAVAATAPLLLVLEDLHWADETSLEFVDTLVRQPVPGPLVLLVLARPAWLERRGGPPAPPPPALAPLWLHLGPLPPEESASLAAALLAPAGPVPAALRDLLTRRAHGNPFFMEELVRMLVDDGTIDAGQRPWRIAAGRLDTPRVPDTLVGVLQARLDTLPADELATLQQASIIGETFWASALEALEPDGPARLPALVRRGLLVRRPASAFAQTDEYAFQHQLLHEVTYGTVLKAMRREGHARAARWLAARAGGREEEFLAVTAGHFERAGDSAQALACFIRAHRSAERRFAHAATLALVDRAMAQPALTAPRQRFRLLKTRQAVFDHLERRDEARAEQQAMHEWAEACDDDVMRADVAVARMLRADHEGRIDEAETQAAQAVALGERSGDVEASAALALGHGEMAWLALTRRDHARAARHLEEGRVHARRCARLPADQGGSDGYELQLHCIGIRSLLVQERHAEAARVVRESLDQLVRAARPKPHDRYILLEFLVDALRELGRHDEARAAVQECVAQALELAMPRLQMISLMYLADVALDQRDLAAAADAIDQAQRLQQVTPNAYVRPMVLRLRGRLAHERGRPQPAREAWTEAAAAYRAHGEHLEAARVNADLAAMTLAEGRPAEALALVGEVLATVAEGGAAAGSTLPARAQAACVQVLAAVRDERAGALAADLRRRLRALLAAAPDAEDQARLLALPHWAAVQALQGRPA